MKKLHYIIYLLLLGCSISLISCSDDEPPTTRVERKSIARGNKYYEEGNFAEAEAEYRKALQSNPASNQARFNLASALMGMASQAEDSVATKYKTEASKIFNDLAKSAKDTEIREKSFYNLGNISFNDDQFDKAIEYYKDALRINPDNDLTRENLRLAQLRQQQNQDQNQDQNKDQNQDQDKDKKDDNKDQDKQDQNKDQNQNQDKEQDQQQQDQQQQNNSMSDENAEQILKAMENEEFRALQNFNSQQRNRPARRNHGPQY